MNVIFFQYKSGFLRYLLSKADSYSTVTYMNIGELQHCYIHGYRIVTALSHTWISDSYSTVTYMDIG